MKNKIVLTLAILLIGILLSSTGISIASAFPDNVVTEKVFTTYVIDPVGIEGTDTYNEFQYTGVHWPTGTTVTYSVNMKGAPAGAKEAVQAAFETWDAAIGDTLFSDTVLTANSKAVGNKYDGANVISWGRMQPRIIAQTTTWYRGNEIVEVGMVFNTNYRWSIGPSNNAFDVQEIATHEAGHTLMLLDLYDNAASQLTMYGYGDFGETYAQSLGAGDISGIHYIYG